MVGVSFLGNGVFDKKLNTFCRTYLIKGNEHLIKDVRAFDSEYRRIKKQIAEDLLMHDKVSFYVYGENIPLAILINCFGVKGVENLLEQGAIEFVLDNSVITYLVDDCPGVCPLQSGVHNDGPYANKEDSIEMGLSWMANSLLRKEKRNIIRKTAKAYRFSFKDRAAEAVQFAHDGYNNDLFANMGLPRIGDIENLPREDKAKLCSLAAECAELKMISQFGYSIKNNYSLMVLLENVIKKMENANVIEEYTNVVFYNECVPNFRALIEGEVISFFDVPRLRGTYNAKRFREWIANESQNVNDSNEIVRKYIEAITTQKGFFESNEGKFIKTLGTTALSASVGSVVAGLPGAVVAVPVLQPLVDLGLNLFDTYILSSFLKGWNPHHYFENDITKLLQKR